MLKEFGKGDQCMNEEPSDLEKKMNRSDEWILICAFSLIWFTPIIAVVAADCDRAYPPDPSVSQYDRVMSANRFAPLRAVWEREHLLEEQKTPVQR